MAGFFDRFKDLDGLKDQAEKMIQEGVKETRRQAELLKLRARIMDLERRMNVEFRVLGERVWELHDRQSLQPENLTGAFDLLEALATEVDEAKEDMEALLKAKEDEDAAEPAESVEPAEQDPAPAAGDDDPVARRLEPAGPSDDPPLE